MIKNKGALIINTLKLFWPILGKNTTELVLLFHKNITKLVFFAQYGPKKLQSVNSK